MTPPPITTARARSGITGRVHQILDIRSSPNTLIAIRFAFWIGAATALLWAPVHGARNIPLFRAWEPVSDALFVAFAAWSFLAAQRGRPVAAGVLGALAVGTRVLGLALLPALLVLLWPRNVRASVRLAPLLLLPAALAGYALYLRHRFGDA